MFWKYRRHVKFAHRQYPILSFSMGCLAACITFIVLMTLFAFVGPLIFKDTRDSLIYEIAGLACQIGILGLTFLAFSLSSLFISRPRKDVSYRSQWGAEEALRDAFLEKVIAIPQADLAGQLKFMADEIETCAESFFELYRCTSWSKPLHLEDAMGSQEWWKLHIMTQTLKTYRREEILASLSATVPVKMDVLTRVVGRWDTTPLYHLDLAKLESELHAAIQDLQRELAAAAIPSPSSV